MVALPGLDVGLGQPARRVCGRLRRFGDVWGGPPVGSIIQWRPARHAVRVCKAPAAGWYRFCFGNSGEPCWRQPVDHQRWLPGQPIPDRAHQ